MNSLSILGKYLDQPKLVSRFSNSMPAILIATGSLYSYNHIRKTPKEQKRKELIKDVAILTGTIGASLIAVKGMKPIIKNGKTIFKGFKGLQHTHEHGHACAHGHEHAHHEETAEEIVEEYLEHTQVSEKIDKILQKAKEKILSFSEIKTIFKELSVNKEGKEFLDELIPNPENIDSKHIFSEIKRLSILGLVPVLGGVGGGIIGDKLTEKDWKKRIPNKVKEGSYQYLANIFLCNVGAGAALLALEKAKITSKPARAVGMIAGIILTGIIGGSAVANLLGKIFIDPLFKKEHGHKLYDERTPEALDISLHIDDVSTVAVLSGLKWIEPALPILYSISGYRAGIGYRNQGEDKK